MIIVTINNSYSKVDGLTNEQLRLLKKVLSYNTNASAAFFAGGNYPRVRYLIDNKGNFPTGLLYLVDKFMIDSKISYHRHDLRVKPKYNYDRFVLNLDVIPYMEQTEAANRAAVKHRGIISAITGSGKSLMIGLVVHGLQCRTLIVAPSVELKQQLSDSMAKWFGKDKVGKGKDIYVENVQALDPNTAVSGYDCVIIDEFHHSGAATYRNLNKTAWKDIYYRFGFTSTPFRSNEDERLLLESVLSEVIYRLDYKTAAAKGYIVPVEAYYVELPKSSTDYYTWAEVYSKVVVNNEYRNELIAYMLLGFAVAKKSTLCLVKEIRHGEILSKLTGIPFVNGQDEKSRQYIQEFNNGHITAIIGTEGVIGEGVDTRACEIVVIAGLGKAKSAFMQKIGRTLRKFPGKESGKVILFKDFSHKFTLRHFKEQIKILKEEYGVMTIKLKDIT